MRLLKSIWMLIFGLFVLGPCGVLAQSGTVNGRVTDAQTGDPLPGATVRIAETSFGAATGLDGRYRIVGVAAGAQRLVISYIGYQTAEFDITVPVGGTVRQDAAISFGIVEGQEVVVTAQLEGQARAINQQLSSNTIVNVVSSDKIQELPDANAAETLARLPGISVQRDAGEGQKVVVRGLSPKFNSITVNGERIPSTDQADRSVDLSMISPDVLAGIEVFKSLTPDKDADAVGGTVNFVIRNAPEGLRGNFRLQAGYNAHVEETGPFKATGSLSNRFLAGKLGVLLTGNFQRADRSSDLLDADYSFASESRDGQERGVIRIENLNLGDRIETRDRFGGSAAFDYALKNGSLRFNTFWSQTDRDEIRRRKRYRLGATRTEYDLRDRDITTALWTNSLSGRHEFPGAELTWQASYSRSRQRMPFSFTARFRELAAFDAELLDDTGGPDLIPQAAKNLIDRTFFKDSAYDTTFVLDRDFTAQADLKVPFNVGNVVTGYLKTGGKYRDKFRDRDNTRWWTSSFNINNLGAEIFEDPDGYYRTFDLDIQRRILISNFIDPEFDTSDFLEDRFAFGPGLDQDALLEFGEQFYDDIFVIDERVDLEDYEAGEAIAAGYLMAEVNLGRRVMVLPGFRYERTETEYTSIFGRPISGDDGQAGIGSRRDTTGGQTYGEFLPMAHLRYRPTDWFDIRLAVTKTLSRPNYFNLVPWERIDFFDNNIERGNADLKHSKAWNYDAFLSFYNRLGLFTVGGFYKEVEGIDYLRQTRITEGEFNGFQLTEPVNAEGTSTVYGFEVELQTNLRFLPSPLDGVVLYANYSRIYSETFFPFFEIGPRSPDPPFRPIIIDTVRAGRLPGQADYIANLSVGYEKGGFTGRISMIYQGPSLQFVGTRGELDGFTNTFARWDLAVQQKIGRGLSVYLNVNNLTDRPEAAFLGIETFATVEEFFGWTADLGVRYKF